MIVLLGVAALAIALLAVALVQAGARCDRMMHEPSRHTGADLPPIRRTGTTRTTPTRRVA